MRGWWWKSRPKKSNRHFDFFGGIIITHRRSYDDCDWGRGVCGWLGDKNCDRKNHTIFDFFGCDFRHPISPHQQFWEFKILKTVWQRRNITNSRVLRLRWVNCWKCWMKTQYCEFEDPAIAMGEIGWRKSLLKKLKTSVWFFLATIFVTQFPPLQSQDPLNSRYCVFVQHFWEFVFNFFGRNFHHPITPPQIAIPSNSQYCVSV